MNYIVIKRDLFNISKRLRFIDRNLRVVYNPFMKRFELQRKSFGEYKLEEILPFENLDCRVIDRVFMSKSIDYETMIRDIDEYNARLDDNRMKENRYVRKNKLKEIYDYSSLSKDFDPDKSFKSFWI